MLPKYLVLKLIPRERDFDSKVARKIHVVERFSFSNLRLAHRYLRGKLLERVLRRRVPQARHGPELKRMWNEFQRNKDDQLGIPLGGATKRPASGHSPGCQSKNLTRSLY